MGGFECSTHRIRSGRRLDMIAATAHDRFARQDYERLSSQGLRVAREGVRWHLVERRPGEYDFSSVLPIVKAARETETHVIWDLCHFGWPDHIDIFKPEFISGLARFGRAFALWLNSETDSGVCFVPINEISFFSWAAGDEGSIFPFACGRGHELKRQLVRASIEAMEAIWSVTPEARFAHIDPIIHVVAMAHHPEERPWAEAFRLSQYEAWDMLAGLLHPELGGSQKYLDIIGVNFYPHNEWFYNLKGFRPVRPFQVVPQSHPAYRPLREMLREVYGRYRRPLFIAETGAEDERRPGWFRQVCREVHGAILNAIPVEGICLYPVVNHPGWIDNRHCHNGLWDYPDAAGQRKIFRPLATELRRARKLFQPEALAPRVVPEPTEEGDSGKEMELMKTG
jgi:hypothetical protein